MRQLSGLEVSEASCHSKAMDEFTAPTLIIAMPQLLDPNFHRTVVLLIEKNDQGAFGLVVNRLGSVSIPTLCSGLKIDWGGETAAKALYGGPVGTDQGFLLHGPVADDLVVNSKEIIRGIRIASDLETFRALCSRPPEDFRVLLGYAGWGPGQLEREMVAGAWLTCEVSPGLVFQTSLEEMWEKALRGLGIDPVMLVNGGGIH